MPEPTRFVYVIGAARTGVVKIGVAAEPISRLRSLQIGNPHRLRLLVTLPGDGDLERHLHERFASRRLTGEWFDFGTLDAVDAVAAAVSTRHLAAAQPDEPTLAPASAPVTTLVPASAPAPAQPPRVDSVADGAALRLMQEACTVGVFVPSTLLLARVLAEGDPEWTILTPRAAQMRLASTLSRFGVQHTRGYFNGRQCWGYRCAELLRAG